MTKEPRLSKSRVKTYERCPRQYKLKYVDGIEIDETPAALVKGIQVHDMLEEFYEGNETIYEAIDHMSDHQHAEEYATEMKNFINFNKRLSEDGEELVRPIVREGGYKDEEINVKGYVDAVFDHDVTLVLDYKTGKVRDLQKYRFELAIYHRLVENNTDIDPTHWGIYFVDHDKLKIEPVDQEEVVSAIHKVAAVRRKINNNEFPKNPSIPCKWCQYHGEYCDGV